MGLRTAFNALSKMPPPHGTCIELRIINSIYESGTVQLLSSSSGAPILMEGHTSFTVDWGDGNREEVSDMLHLPSHDYITGEYRLTISNDLVKTPRIFCLYTMVIKSIASGLIDGSCMFQNCSGLTGAIPDLPKGLTNGAYMFEGCRFATSMSPLPKELTDGSNMFYGCSGLTSMMPRKLPSGLTNGNSMFAFCEGLTGAIPELPSGLTDGNSMFASCSGLTGAWTDDTNLLMPSHVANHSQHVGWCAAAVRAKYYVSWGGTIPDPPPVCLASDTLITMADGTTKRVDELRVGDKVLAVNPYTFEAIEDEVSYSDSETELWDSVRDEWTFDDGSTVTTVHPHEFYNVRTECMEYIADFEIGDRVRKQDGTTAALVSRKTIKERTRHNTLFTRTYNNYFANGILAGNRHSTKWGWEWCNLNC